jgi:hypothetical protein
MNKHAGGDAAGKALTQADHDRRCPGEQATDLGDEAPDGGVGGQEGGDRHVQNERDDEDHAALQEGGERRPRGRPPHEYRPDPHADDDLVHLAVQNHVPA